jgi:uncharacterized protein
MMDEFVAHAVNERVWAVVGASNDRMKFGNRIYRDLRSAGYRVFPVNPNEETIEGDRAYARIQDLPGVPVVIDVVVPASVGFHVLKDAIEAGSSYFWLQPGAESPELIARARASDIKLIFDRCAMVEKISWNTTDGNSRG